jgi:nucleoside-diphosphate-sugar epimerase
MSEPQLHVVFGAGQIGPPLARLLRERGHRVRIVRRAGGGPEGVEVVHGDAGDPAFAAGVVQGASAVYHCMNPAYDAALWERELPRLMDALVAAAGRAKARLVVLDNLYMLGATHGVPMNEDTPMNPCSRKGAIRARVAARLFAAHERGDVRAVSGRAADFYGPGGVQTYYGDQLWTRLLAGKSAQVLTDPDIVHAHHFTLDVAAGLATLGTAPDDVTGRWWMLPAAPAVTPRALIGAFAEALGRPVAIERMPGWMLGALRLFMPFLRELDEMGYQWTEPFLVDDRRFRERFGAAPTPIAEGARATVAWAREHYAAR